MIRSLFAFLMLVQVAVLPAIAQDTGPEGGSAEPQDAPNAFALAEPKEAAGPASVVRGQIEAAVAAAREGPVRIYVIRIDDPISVPALYMVRTGVKQAEATGADWVVLDLNTPGGRLDVTLEIMEILGKFSGRTATFVNSEAISAGAFISAATDEIYFAPGAVIGAAAPVSGGGEDIQKTMKQKITSYLAAKVRAISEEHPRRGMVITAMMDADYELKIDDVVIKAPGVLLSLTAKEAMKTYGDPPEPLLGAGIVDSIDGLTAHLAGGARVQREDFQHTWSLDLARWLNAISPFLMSVGLLMVMIEFKTPGFGVLGAVGIGLILIVLFGHHVAGLSGKEPMLLFVLGAALVLLEVLVFPGTIFVALTGIVLMLASLVWGMTDIWPGQAFELTPAMFVRPVANVAIALVLTVVLGVALARFLPRGWIWDRIVLQRSVTGVSSAAALAVPGEGAAAETIVGRTGRAVTDLRPAGEIEVDGRRLEARVEVGSISAGATVRVVRRADFVYIVEEVA